MEKKTRSKGTAYAEIGIPEIEVGFFYENYCTFLGKSVASDIMMKFAFEVRIFFVQWKYEKKQKPVNFLGATLFQNIQTYWHTVSLNGLVPMSHKTSAWWMQPNHA